MRLAKSSVHSLTRVVHSTDFWPTGRAFPFDFPGAVLTSAWGINSAGQIVGDYRLADNVLHGFLAQPGNKAKPQ
jgi:hypothetical protein